MQVMPDFSTWRTFVKEGDCDFLADKGEPLYDIDAHKVGVLRTRQKFCYPCDNSIIRVDKNWVANKRYGASVVSKDQLSFGIRERDSIAEEKTLGDDEIVNMDTRKDTDRRCEFWLEFENKVRLHIEMLSDPEVQND